MNTTFRGRFGVAIALAATVSVLAACSSGSGGSESGAEAFAAPTSEATAGDSIPEATVKAGFSPYGDELMGVAGIARGYFDQVGITIDPAPNGAQTDLIGSLTPLINDQIELGSGYIPAIASQLDNVDNVVGFGISDVFYGYRLLAPAGKYTTLSQAMAEGQSYEEAVTTVLDQVKGQDVILRQGVVPTFYNLITGTAGGAMTDWNVEYLANPDIVRAAQVGQADFVSPTGAVEISRLQMDGWEPLIDLQQVVDNMPEEETVSLRSTFSGYLTTTDYATENWDTLLRFTSVMYRLIDDMEADPVGVSADFVDYLNSYTGSSLTPEELAATFDGLYSLRDFEAAAALYDDGDDAFNFQKVAGAQVADLSAQGVIGEGHTADQLSIAGAIYDALVEYRAKADAALASAPDSELTQQAQEQYDARNYLDAYRLAEAANETS
ncbi:hypothetical protein [Rhodococcoides kyotonense]|uniref:ABC-type nitrate/sulfonate/bicarbonate transport system, substrate-binding protein n=1 Tax=Rhodococcoides kyotonense TaxID=398843 RepID=A0A239JYU7_9NOCA|nr:hypothetical protein [Rhodococcus kyotonensis]SNT10642.1 ABC-type nitrate/sulfonate/bicarbonate transport system, substrate-binding protein [Rhodococcus kyotonensis]